MDYSKGVYERGDAGGLGEIWFKFLKLYNNKISQIMVDTDEKDTFSDLLLRSVRLALALQREDEIQPGDILGIYTDNNRHSCIPFIASQFLGAITCHFDFKMSEEMDIYYLKLVQPKLIISTAAKVEQVEKCIEKANLKIKCIVFEDTERYPKFSDYLAPQEHEETFTPYPIKNNDTIAVIVFSSGATGIPKGVLYSHYALIKQRNLERFIFVSHVGDSIFTSLLYTTPFWISAISSTVFSLIQGNCRILCSRYEPAKTWDIIEKYKVNFLFLVPYRAQEFLDNRPKRNVDVSSLSSFWTGAYPCPKQILENLINALPNTLIVNGYGQTETGTIASYDLSSVEGVRMVREKSLSVGQILKTLEWKVVDVETEEYLGPHQTGELRVKADCFMIGYYKMDSSQSFDSEGFWMTGDLVYYDEDKYVYVIGRRDDIFKNNDGFKIVPSSLEETLLSHPAVKEAVVIGIDKNGISLSPMGVVILNEGYTNVTPKDIKQFFEEQVSIDQRLTAGVKIVQRLPKTANDKIRRNELKRMVIHGEI